jgi:hypothetical protein
MMQQIGFSKIYPDSSLFYSSKHGLILWFMYIEHMIITIGHKVEMCHFFFFFLDTSLETTSFPAL